MFGFNQDDELGDIVDHINQKDFSLQSDDKQDFSANMESILRQDESFRKPSTQHQSQRKGTLEMTPNPLINQQDVILERADEDPFIVMTNQPAQEVYDDNVSDMAQTQKNFKALFKNGKKEESSSSIGNVVRINNWNAKPQPSMPIETKDSILMSQSSLKGSPSFNDFVTTEKTRVEGKSFKPIRLSKHTSLIANNAQQILAGLSQPSVVGSPKKNGETNGKGDSTATPQKVHQVVKSKKLQKTAKWMTQSMTSKLFEKGWN